MKPTKIRNQQIYRASLSTRSKQLGSPLSHDLRKKYGKRTMRLGLGDSVKIMRGEYKGVDGKVSKVSTEKNSVGIEGIKKEKSKGDKFDVYIHASNVMITGLNTDDGWRRNKLEGSSGKSSKEKKVETEEKPVETKLEKSEAAEVKSSKEMDEKKSEKSKGKLEKPKQMKEEKIETPKNNEEVKSD